MSLSTMAVDLTDLGSPEDALAASEEATDTYRQLAVGRPDAFRPDLAGSLNNLAIVLAGLGRREYARPNHVQHILTKLGFHNRSQIAAWAARTTPDGTAGR